MSREQKALGKWLDSPVRWTIEIYLWMTLTVIVVILCVFLPDLWTKVSIVYLAIVSNYALVLTAAGARQAAEARIAATGSQVDPKAIRDDLVAHTTLEQANLPGSEDVVGSEDGQ